MVEVWPRMELAEVGVAVLDCVHKTPTDAGEGYVYLAIPNIRDNRIDLSKVRRITKEDFETWTSRYKPAPGDVLVTRRGRVGDTAVIPEGMECAIGQNLVLLRSNGTLVDQRYLSWACRGPDWWAEVKRLLNVGAVFDSLNVRDLPRFRLPVPSIQEQRQIAGVLGALDDLIDTNRRIANDCMSLWRAVVRDALADAGESVPLTELADFANGKNFTKKASGRGRPVIRTPEVRRGPEAKTVRSGVDAAEANLAREGDILFVWSGSLVVGRWMWEEGLINQHVFKVVPKPGIPAWLVFALIEYQMPWFLNLAADKATTMGHIKREHLDAEVPVPSSAEVERLGPIVEPLWNEALQGEVAIEELGRIRDELLPLLLSGRVRVEEMV